MENPENRHLNPGHLVSSILGELNPDEFSK
jgi:hypothetical protein